MDNAQKKTKFYKSRRMRALSVIEFLSAHSGDWVHPKEIATTIYKYSHIAVGRCSNKHTKWAEELDKAYLELYKGGEL